MTVALKDSPCKPHAHGQAEPRGGACQLCGRPRCSAAAKTRPGERCRKNPHPGASICTNHGLTEAGRAKAAARVQEAEAWRVLSRVWDPAAKPVTDAVGALQRLAGQLDHSLHTIGGRLGGDGELCSACGRSDLSLDSPEALAWLRVVREQRQLLEAMERLGIAQRFVQVEAARVELIAVALGRVFDELGLDEEQRVVGGRVLLDELRAREGQPGPPELGGAA